MAFLLRPGTALSLAAFLFLRASASCLAQGAAAEAHAGALEALDGGRADEAVTILEPVVELDPGAIELLELLGKAYLKTGQESQAEEVGERVLRAFPDRDATRLWLAQVLERQGRVKEARLHYRVLLRSRPPAAYEASSLAALGLARSHLREGEHEEALPVILSLLRETPGGEAVDRFVGGLGDLLDGAVAAPDDRAPAGSPELLRLRAFGAEGREAEAIVEVERMLGERPADPDRWIAALEVLHTLKRPQDAAGALERALPDPPPAARPVLARLLRKASALTLVEGNPPRAVMLLRRALEALPPDPGIRRELGWAELKAGDPAGALRAWEPLLESPLETSQIQGGAVKALRALDAVPEALERARRELRGDPENVTLRRLYWSLLEEVGGTEELLRSLDPQALPAVDPAVGSAAAEILGRRRKEPPFRALLERWSARLPRHPTVSKAEAKALREEARLARSSGDPGRVASLFGRLAALYPDNPRDRAEFAGAPGAKAASGETRPALEEAQPQSEEGRLSAAEAARSGERGPSALPEPSRVEPGRTSLPGVFREGAILLVDALSQAEKSWRALEVLTGLAAATPEDEKLLLRFLRAACHAGEESRAIEVLEDLRMRMPPYPAPRSVLISRFLERRDLKRAKELLAGYLTLFPEDIDKWILLGEVELDREDPSSARDAFRSARGLSWENVKARLGLALAEVELENHQEALAISDEILSVNPHFHWARTSRLKALILSGDLTAAMEEWDRAFRMFPNEQDLLLLKASLLAGKERYADSLLEVEKVLDLARGGALPILLYHGISPHFESEALAAPLFRDQMRALRDAGYVTLGLAEVESWVRGERALPERAILITFDDARLDNLLLADPILAELGLRAVQFVPTGFVREERSFYMSWSDLRRLQASGRWDFGAHGHMAHKPFPLDASGTRGNFLVSRRWIPEEGRNESPLEMEARVREDHRICRKRLEEELGLKDVGTYAFPFGSFGQRDLANEPDAYPLNLRVFPEHFRLGFYQTESGYNLPRKGPFLSRFSVPETWDGERLLAHLRESHPRAQARLERGVILSWSGRAAEALRELEEASALGAAPIQVWKARGRTLLWRGDLLGSLEAFRRLVDLDPTDARVLTARQEAERPFRPAASLELWWSFDREKREVFRQTARGEISVFPRLRLHAEAGHASYSEPRQSAVEAGIAQVGALALPGDAMEVEAALGEHWFDGGRDRLHYSAAVRGKVLDLLDLEGEAAGGPVQTPRAVLQGIHLDAQSAVASLRLTHFDRLAFSYQHGFYSDGNLRDTFRGEYSHRVLRDPAVHLGLEGTLDDTRKEVPEYYSPDDLHLHRIFARLDASLARRLWITTRLAGGYGWEDRHGRPAANALFRFRWLIHERLELSAELTYLLNPRYWEATAGPVLLLRF